MATHQDLENPLELEMLNSKDVDKVESDTKDGRETEAPRIEKEELTQA